MAILTLLALITSYPWKKLIENYGRLNTGKFEYISQLEKELKTNMSKDEWNILSSDKIKYESNTSIEKKIINWCRVFIFICLVVEIIYLLYELYPINICICNK